MFQTNADRVTVRARQSWRAPVGVGFGADDPDLPWGFFGCRENFEPPAKVLKFPGLATADAVCGALTALMAHGSCGLLVASRNSIFQVFVDFRLWPSVRILAELAWRRKFSLPN